MLALGSTHRQPGFAPYDGTLEPAGGWLALEHGRTQLSDLLRAGPRCVADAGVPA